MSLLCFFEFSLKNNQILLIEEGKKKVKLETWDANLFSFFSKSVHSKALSIKGFNLRCLSSMCWHRFSAV